MSLGEDEERKAVRGRKGLGMEVCVSSAAAQSSDGQHGLGEGIVCGFYQILLLQRDSGLSYPYCELCLDTILAVGIVICFMHFTH